MASDHRVGYLEDLGQAVGSRGLVARVVRTGTGPAFLRVVNPEAGSLAEDITCAPAPAGRRTNGPEAGGAGAADAPRAAEHYYWWSWGERMHRVDDPGGAASKLAHVLQPLRH